MRRTLLAACAVFCLAIVPVAVSGQDGDAAVPDRPGETKDRLTQDRMAELAARPMAIVESQGVAAGKAAFDRQLAEARARHGARSVEVADLLTAFGVGLYTSSLDTDERAMKAEALPYLEAAIPAYRAAFGDAHPEVAVALNTLASAQLGLNPDNPPQSAETALEEAYRIRLAAFGPTNAETLASLGYLARIKGHPTRTQGDRGRIEAVAALFRQLIANSTDGPPGSDVAASYGHAAFARMYAENRMVAEAREQLRLAVERARRWPAAERCVLVAMQVAAVEEMLGGPARRPRDNALPGSGGLVECFALDDEPAEEPPVPTV